MAVLLCPRSHTCSICIWRVVTMHVIQGLLFSLLIRGFRLLFVVDSLIDGVGNDTTSAGFVFVYHLIV